MFEVDFLNKQTGVRAKYWEVKALAFDLEKGIAQAVVNGKVDKDLDTATQVTVTTDLKSCPQLGLGLPQIRDEAQKFLKRNMAGDEQA